MTIWSLEKLTFLTNSLIKMSRLESGIIRLKPEQSSLNDIVMQIKHDKWRWIIYDFRMDNLPDLWQQNP